MVAELGRSWNQGGALRAPQADASARPQPQKARPACVGPHAQPPMIDPARLIRGPVLHAAVSLAAPLSRSRPARLDIPSGAASR